MSQSSAHNTNFVKDRYAGGPHGVGDPEDQSLRKVEVEVLIPKKMREIAKEEKCVEEVRQFTECCRDSSLLMVVMCRKQNSALKQCLTKWYDDKEFKERCRREYLAERTAYRKTGVPLKQRIQKLPISM